MARLGKYLSICVVVILVVSFLNVIQLSDAQTVTPAVPQFTVKYVDNTYVYPPTYSTDPYSGESVRVGGGFTVINKTIELTIKNQQFTSYYDDGNSINIYYRVGYKGHYETEWHYYTEIANSNSDKTVIWVGLAWDGWSSPDIRLSELSAGDKVDFKVQSEIGYFGLGENRLVPSGYSVNYDDLHGEASEWSSTQTFTMSGTPDPTSSNEPTPTVPEFPVIAILPLFVVIPLIAVFFVKKRIYVKAYN